MEDQRHQFPGAGFPEAVPGLVSHDGDPQLWQWIEGVGRESSGISDQADPNDFNPPSPGSRPPSAASSYGSIDSGVSHPPRSGNKRKKRVEMPWSDFDDFGQEDGKSKAQKLARKEEPYAKKFACPFYKRYPQEFKESQICASHAWESFRLAKEHVFHSHKYSAFQCQRCYEEFASGPALSNHLRADNMCEKKAVSDRINVQQEMEIRMRSQRMFGQSLHEGENWNAMYKIIFPDAEVIPSPYYEPPNFPTYHRNILMNQLPSVVRREMNKSMDVLSTSQYFLLMDRIEACVTTALKECLPAMDEAYEKEDSK